MVYYKITNKEETENGISLTDGLNIYDKPFSKYILFDIQGFYFTTLEHIHNYYDNGVYLREVEIPHYDNDIDIHNDGNKSRTNKIILGARYSLYDPETYLRFKLDVSKNISLIDYLSGYGYVDNLIRFKQNSLILCYSTDALDWASEYDHVEVLDWWKSTGLELKYTKNAVVMASYNGNIKILEWWKKSGYELKYDEEAIQWASANNNTHILEWWKNSGYDLKYDEYAIEWACANGHVDVLNWWLYSGLEIKYNENAITAACANGHIVVLQWWLISNLVIKYDKNAIFRAAMNGFYDVLEWWINSKLELKYDNKEICKGLTYRNPIMLKWWKRIFLLKTTTNDIICGKKFMLHDKYIDKNLYEIELKYKNDPPRENTDDEDSDTIFGNLYQSNKKESLYDFITRITK